MTAFEISSKSSLVQAGSKQFTFLMVFGFSLLLASCESQLTVVTDTLDNSQYTNSRKGGSTSIFKVTDRQPLVVAPGGQITLIGTGFKAGLIAASLLLGEETALAVEVASDTEATVTLPESTTGYGMTNLALTRDGKTQRISVFVDGGKANYPIITATAAEICAGMKFYDVMGALVEGSKNCAVADTEVAECKADGEVGCITTEKVRSAVVSDLAAKVLVGSKVAGVDGRGPVVPNECSTDGATGCLANVNFPSVDKTKLVVGNIKTSVTIAGVAGTVVPRPANCSTDGEVGCVAIGTFKAANVDSFNDGDVRHGTTIAGVAGSLVAAPASCSVDGQASCLATASYTAAATAGLADKILSGQTVAGVSGNVTLPAVGKVLTGTDFGVGGTGSSGSLTLPVAGDVLTSSGTYGDPGAAVTPSYSPDFPAVGNVLSVDTVDGAAGTLILPSAIDVRDTVQYGVAGTGSTGSYLPDLPDVANVRNNDTVGGAAGTLTLPIVSNVLANSSYGSAGNSHIGTLTLPAGGKVLSGSGTYGIAGNGTTPTLTLPTAGDVLTGSGTYGDPGAALTPSFTPDFPAAGNVLSTDTVDGAVGTLTLPTASNVLAGSGTYGVGGTASTPTLTLPTAANVRAANGNFGVAGTGTTPTLTDCSSDGDTDCVVDDGTNYKAVASAVLWAGNIKRGTQIGGVTGNFPSATYPLPRYSDSGATTNTTGVNEPDLTNFQTQLKQTGMFEFWDAFGVRRTGSGDSDITSTNVVSGIDFENLGITGSAVSGSDCTGDGQTGCMTTSRFKSMDTDPSVITAWDLRKGRTAGGIAGEITFYKNMIDLATFNRTTGTGAWPYGADVYSTIDDHNNGGAFPTMKPSGYWDQATGANWLRDPVSDTNTDGLCNDADCVYTDRITGLFWARADAITRNWENAITYCDGLNGSNFGGYGTGWRLPTQKELQQGYVNGVWSQKHVTKLNLTTSYYWSSSTRSNSTSFGWRVGLSQGYTFANTTKTGSNYVVCVR